MDVFVEKRKIGLVAGPCSAENRSQMLDTARGLKALGVRLFRAGLWKPRSRWGSFEGVGKKGLPWMNEIQQELGLKVMTEVALPRHVEAVLKSGIDMVWIGARTTANPFMMSELAEALKGSEMPVWIKNPICPDVALWIGAVERLRNAGIQDVRVIHRGFCVVDSAPYRNAPLWELAEQFRHNFPELTYYCDPSHMAGKRELLFPLCEKALSCGFDGLFVESHNSPEVALSDSAQQLTPVDLGALLRSLYVIID